MPTSTNPVYTPGSAGNIDASASLAASASRNSTWDIRTAFEGQVHVVNTPGGTIAATAGLRVQVFRRYGSTPTAGQTAFMAFTLPSAVANTAESLDFYLGPGNYQITITNLDASNAVTVQITGDTISSLLNS